MFASAFASIANGFSAMAGGPFTDATLWWAGTPVMDDGGSIIDPGTPVEADCRVQVDVATEAMRADVDFQQEDVRLLILSAGLPIVPDEAAEVVIAGGIHAGTYALQTVGRDPIGIGFECRARKAPTAAVVGEPGAFDFSDPVNSGHLALILEDA